MHDVLIKLDVLLPLLTVLSLILGWQVLTFLIVYYCVPPSRRGIDPNSGRRFDLGAVGSVSAMATIVKVGYIEEFRANTSDACLVKP